MSPWPRQVFLKDVQTGTSASEKFHSLIFAKLMLFDFTSKVVAYLLYSPLLHVYLYGPRFGSYGFWEGMQMADICLEITGVSAEHWKLHPHLCEHMVHKKFESYLVVVHILLYVFLLRTLCLWSGYLLWFLVCKTKWRENRIPLLTQGGPDVPKISSM